VTAGIWFWGGVTAVLALAALVFIVVAAFYIDSPASSFAVGTPRWISQGYWALKDNNQLVAAILAVSGLAWSYFFQWKK
jgi:hypothetical protein